MKRQNRTLVLVLAVAGLAACGGAEDTVEAVTGVEKSDARDSATPLTPARPGEMFAVDYSIIGTPIVGSPVSIELRIQSAYGGEPVSISYQVPDQSSLMLDESQPPVLTRTPLADEPVMRERVTVIPQREGRLYINVRAARELGDGSQSTMISIPIHVGDVDTSLQEHGVLETNEDGETTRVLTAE
ncbi:MAG: hypothetical protein KJP08_04930 [Gammaproteobacteria bacterium]|nr:hypothetical protein [Gammaproteobacteria bacterium]MBT8094134.1 hypothetical protein [Gammaproteobacteria bacterium]